MDQTFGNHDIMACFHCIMNTVEGRSLKCECLTCFCSIEGCAKPAKWDFGGQRVQIIKISGK